MANRFEPAINEINNAFSLITRHIYGAVVDEINDTHVSNVIVPLLHDVSIQREINEMVLEANSE